MGHLCFMIPKSVLFSSDDGRKYKGKEVHFSTTPTLVGIHMALTDKTANVEKISVQIAFLLHSGMSWGSHNPFRISVRSLSISFSLMQRGERESLGHQKKKSILGICLLADLRPKQIEYQKVDKREIPDFIVQFLALLLLCD